MATTHFLPVVYRPEMAPEVHGLLADKEEKIAVSAIDIPGLLSGDSANILETKDGLLFLSATVDCKFNILDLISKEAGNMSRRSTFDGLLFTDPCDFNIAGLISKDAGNMTRLSAKDGLIFTDSCEFDVAGFVSKDGNQALGFGTDGLLWVDSSIECEINISKLISTDSGNATELGTDGKLYVPDISGCDIDIIKLISSKEGNRIVLGPDGKLYLAPYDCVYNLADWISSHTFNRFKLHTTPGGDGKFLVLSADHTSTSHTPNVLKVATVGDNKLYVDPQDLISTDSNSGLSTGSDGKLTVEGGDFWLKLFGAGNFKLHNGPYLPAGGTWAYLCIQPYWDGDLGGDAGHRWSNYHRGNYLRHIVGAGVGAGGSWIPDVPLIDIFGHDQEQIQCISLVWRIA